MPFPQAGTRLVQAVVKVSSMGSVVRVARWLEENMELVVGARTGVIWGSLVVTYAGGGGALVECRKNPVYTGSVDFLRILVSF